MHDHAGGRSVARLCRKRGPPGATAEDASYLPGLTTLAALALSGRPAAAAGRSPDTPVLSFDASLRFAPRIAGSVDGRYRFRGRTLYAIRSRVEPPAPDVGLRKLR